MLVTDLGLNSSYTQKTCEAVKSMTCLLKALRPDLEAVNLTDKRSLWDVIAS